MVALSGFRSIRPPFSVYRDSSHGNRKNCAGNQARKNAGGDLGQRVRRLRDGREIILGHPHHLVGAPPGLYLHPVVLKYLEFDFLVGQQAHQLKQLLSRNGAAAFFFILASQDVQMLSSRSVAVRRSLLPWLSMSKLERIGMVVLRSTTPCVISSSSNRSYFLTLNSIVSIPSRCLVVAPLMATTIYSKFIEG